MLYYLFIFLTGWFILLTSDLDIPLNSLTSSSVMLTFDHLIWATQASLLFRN